MEAPKVVNNSTREVDRFTLDRLDACFCPRCEEMVIPETLEETCPICSSAVSELDSVIDAVCDSSLASYLHRSVPDEA